MFLFRQWFCYSRKSGAAQNAARLEHVGITGLEDSQPFVRYDCDANTYTNLLQNVANVSLRNFLYLQATIFILPSYLTHRTSLIVYFPSVLICT